VLKIERSYLELFNSKNSNTLISILRRLIITTRPEVAPLSPCSMPTAMAFHSSCELGLKNKTVWHRVKVMIGQPHANRERVLVYQ
jgi:hypothetical protein